MTSSRHTRSRRNGRTWLGGALALSALVVACSDQGGGGGGGPEPEAGAGGAAAAGGSTGMGGSAGTGGATGAGGSTACVPGASAGCVGPGACDGYQVCNSDGQGYGPCECGSPGTGGSTGADGGTGGAEPGDAGSGGEVSLDAPPGAGGAGSGGASSGGASSGGASSGGAAPEDAGGGCGAFSVLTGTATIQNERHVADLFCVGEITGDLVIDAPGMTGIALPHLHTVGGMVGVQSAPAMTSLLLPSLETTGSSFVVGYATVLTSLDVGSLTSVGGLAGTPSLPALNLPSLVTVNGTFHVNEGPSLTQIHAPVLEVVADNLTIGPLPIATVTFPALTRVGQLHLGEARNLVTDPVGVPLTTTRFHFPLLSQLTSAPSNVGPGLWLTRLQHCPTWPSLATIAGDVVVQASTAPALTFPALTQIGGEVALANNEGAALQMPALVTLEGGLRLIASASYAAGSLDLSSLTTLNGPLIVRDASFPGILSLPALAVVDRIELLRSRVTSLLLPLLERTRRGFQLDDNRLLGTVEMPAVTTFGAVVSIQSNDVLTELDWPALLTTGSGLAIFENPAITAIQAPDLTTMSGDLRIDRNGNLTLIDFGSLAATERLQIEWNVDLPNCQAIGLRDQLIAAGWTGIVSIQRNFAGGTCP